MNTEICQTIFEKFNSYNIIIKNSTGVIGNDLNILRNLKFEHLYNNLYDIQVYSKDNKHLGLISFRVELLFKNGKQLKTHLAVYIHIVMSFLKGIGKDLLYLITCKANELNLPIAFTAQADVARANFPPGTNEEVIRAKQDKLLLYYNSLGFTRNGEKEYKKESGLIQHYESQAKNVLLSAASVRKANAERNEFESRTPANWARLQIKRGRGGSRKVAIKTRARTFTRDASRR